MPTVSCVCTSCGNIIPIEEEMLGQQVRCPYCQQVVPTPLFIAPAPAPLPQKHPSEPMVFAPDDSGLTFLAVATAPQAVTRDSKWSA